MTKILVIDDELPLLEEIELILRFGGYEVLSASDPRIGIEMACQQSPDLILCDVMMPYVDGYSVLQRIRNDSLTAHIPFIFVTARSTRDDLRLGMERGANDYVSKPFTHTELLNAVAARLEQQDIVRSAQLRQLSYDLVQAQTAERDHIARQLQEKVGQVLQSAGLILDASKHRMDRFVSERLNEIQNLINNAAVQVAELAMDLHPLMLDHVGLLPTLNWFLERYRQRSTTSVTLIDEKLSPETTLSPEIQKVAYWIVRDALNILAPTLELQDIQIELNGHADLLEIRFSGQSEVTQRPESALLRLYEYAFAFGGMLRFDFPLPGTALLMVQLPLNSEAQFNAETITPITILPPAATTFDNLVRAIILSSHAGTRDTLFKLLTEAGDITVVAAYEHVHQLFVDQSVVIILDLSGGNTLETVDQLVNLYPQTPLLIIGNNTDENTALEVLRHKATGYIMRNAGTEELLHAVRQVYSGRRYLSSPFREQAIEYYIHTKRHAVETDKVRQLTRREREILDWVIAGFTSAEIAERLSLSPRTVETHRTNLMRKLDVHSKWELLSYLTTEQSRNT
ncbi:MAG: response regulator [Anaerolineae bacterium]